ncbi:MAG TPA: TVP38/TMEM64 family protein [bacterium]|nr:TVP38/TMEM64 family protein [bacterium]
MNRKLLLRLGLLALIVTGIALGIVYREHFAPERLEAWIGALGVWAPLVYIGVYLIGPALFVPGAAITIAGGALFGPVWGVLYVLVGSVGGATLAFVIARYLAGDWVEQRASGVLRQVKEGVEAEGWHFVAFTRLVPLFPFSLLNYALGLTRIRLLTYVITSAICMLPGIAGYVYLGYAGREALLGGENLLRKISIAVAVFAALVFLPLLVRRLRAMRRRSVAAAGGPPAEAGTPRA